MQRHQVGPHPLHHRHGEQEHHGAAVGGEEPVVEVGSQQLVLGPRELQPHQRRLDAARGEKQKRRDHEALADRGVAHLAQPVPRPRPGSQARGQQRLARARQSLRRRSAARVIAASPDRRAGPAARVRAAACGGIRLPGLMPCESLDPAGQVAAHVGDAARRQRGAARQVGEVGSHGGGGDGPVDGVAHRDRRCRRNMSRPRIASRRRRSGAGCRCCASQCSKLVGRAAPPPGSPSWRAARRRTRRTARASDPAGRPGCRWSNRAPG